MNLRRSNLARRQFHIGADTEDHHHRKGAGKAVRKARPTSPLIRLAFVEFDAFAMPEFIGRPARRSWILPAISLMTNQFAGVPMSSWASKYRCERDAGANVQSSSMQPVRSNLLANRGAGRVNRNELRQRIVSERTHPAEFPILATAAERRGKRPCILPLYA